ncbi:MAG TPA: D-alanyl-lipoteichoic acid biosynthesis protein DltD, partial [Bacteroidia bacterium]|nr:D-alanyl-lipoteichoic acid biosynthesis protein DltD [Bacteroidia bacterium]
IIMQALNPLSYDNLEELDPVLEMAEKEVKAFGFQYLNLHMSDKNDYQPGLLNDFQHLGPYGWLKINREIFNYFNTNE